VNVVRFLSAWLLIVLVVSLAVLVGVVSGGGV